MKQVAGNIKSFIDLHAWQEAHKLLLLVYRLTQPFPKEEQFGLTPQLRRAVLSVSSNIAEGFSRSSIKDKTHFYTMAQGSLTESQNQLLAARDLGYLPKTDFQLAANQSVTVHKLLTGLIKSTKGRETP